MKKIHLLLIFCLIVLKTQAQTRLKYSGNATNNILPGFTKAAGIGENTDLNGSNPANFHVGLIGYSNNATFSNVGVLGTTYPNSVANNSNYIAVWGDNESHNIVANDKSVIGGDFQAQNFGTNGYTVGVSANARGDNNSNSTIGVDVISSNPTNTTVNRTIAVKGVTTSGQSTVTNIFKDVANPGGYFSSSDGQGIYATTTGTYKSGSTTVSQAVTGYSNVINAFDNIGILGDAEGTGNYKIGVLGTIDGAAGSAFSSGIYGSDAINTSNTYAGYFDGKVYINDKIGVGVRTVNSTEQMEVNGRIRIRRNTFASGLWFNNNVNGTGISDGAFVGLSNETPGSETVGFWVGGNFKFLVDRLGNTTVNGGLSVGGGQTINKIIKTTISANINAYVATSFLTQTFPITGVSVGDNIVVNIDSLPANFIIASTRISANDTIEVKFYNFGGANGFPTAVTIYVTAFK